MSMFPIASSNYQYVYIYSILCGQQLIFLKLSTIYSFKGWEADNIILFIQKPEPPNAKYDEKNLKPIEEAPEKALCPKVIYTALSRAKVNLFIINLGHAQYDQFFKKNIN